MITFYMIGQLPAVNQFLSAMQVIIMTIMHVAPDILDIIAQVNIIIAILFDQVNKNQTFPLKLHPASWISINIFYSMQQIVSFRKNLYSIL